MFNYTLLPVEECDFVEIARLDDLSDGERIFLEIDDLKIVLFNISDEYFAISDVCTHDDGPLGDGELDRHDIICPRHGARFDVRTGKVMALPAIVDIPSYPVRVVSGTVQLGIPKKTG